MFKNNPNRSVRYKFLKDISIILFISTCVLSAVIAVNVGTILEKALTNKALSFATNIAKRNENALIMSGSTKMNTVYSELITDEDIIYTIIKDDSGKILTTQFESINFKWPELKNILPLLSRDSNLSDIIETIKRHVAVKEISIPIMIGTDTMGSVSIGMSRQNINNQIARTALFVIILNLIAACVLGAVLFTTSKKTIMDPIIELGHAASRLAKGDLSTQVKITSQGEIQMLVNSFNQMAENLQKTTVSKDYVNDIIGSMVDALIVVNSDLCIEKINHSTCALTGYHEHELIGNPLSTIIATGVQDFHRELQRLRRFEATQIENYETYFRAKDGKAIPILFNGSAIQDKKGTINNIVCVARDITELKLAEESLKTSERRFRSIIEHATEGIMVIDAETRLIRYANPEICRILGFSVQEFLSHTLADLIINEEQSVSAVETQTHLDGSMHTSERTFQKKNGSPVRMSINSVQMEFDGRPSQVGFFSNISEKRRIEEERQKLQRLESIGTLAGGIAHDFNNQLQGIFGYISMAKMNLDQKQKSLAMLEQAEKTLHQSVNLSNQLLTFSKGGKPLTKLIDLKPVIENAVRFSLSGSRIEQVLSIANDLASVEVDEGQISQVLQNIVLNAEQAMQLGGRITIVAKNEKTGDAPSLLGLREGNFVAITIQDQGIGIPPEHLERIFDPYFTTKKKGSGLGLATSYSIMRNHGGAITVSSTLGKGSKFTVYIPASDAPLEQIIPMRQRESTRKARILIMDDEQVVRDVSRELIRELGHEVEVAKHGQEALEKYQGALTEGKPFDIVILDLTIRGGMGGVETVQELLKRDPQVKAVVSSGYSDDAATANYMSQGFKASLKKPYDINALRGALNEILNS
jgi:two-component system, cell cycle sensor histidine kinase and response regulator CckA